MKNKKDFRIVFMGTPEFAVESLKALVENDYNVVGVVTMPDKPAGRGHKLQFSAVKEYAMSQNLPILQPEKLKDPEFLDQLKALNADLQIVVAFRMLPEVVWDMPHYGTFNLHASLLPQYRGAAPINWAIINGDKETGVTTFFLTHEIDTGKVIKQEKVQIGDDENIGSLYDRLMNLGGNVVTQTVDMILSGEVDAVDQETMFNEPSELRAAPKIFKDTCKINWADKIENIHNLVRGMSPYPAAWGIMYLNGSDFQVKIYETKKITENHNLPIGTIKTDNKTYLNVAAKDGFISILSLQLPGKKRMDITSFLNGTKLIEGSCFVINEVNDN